MGTQPVTVLLTCVGGALSDEVIQGMIGCPELPLRVVGVDSVGSSAGRQAAAAFYQVPGGAEPGYADAVLEVCRAEGVQVVIPRADEEVEALSAVRSRFESLGIRCAVPDQTTVQVLRHKGRVFDVLQAAGIDVPRYRIVSTLEELETAVKALQAPGQPLVVKPCVSRGGRGVVILHRPVRWEDQAAVWGPPGRWPQLLVMDYLPGPAYDVDLVSRGGEVLCLGIRRRYNPAGVPFGGCRTEADAGIEHKARAIASALRLDFGGDIDLAVSREGIPHVLEVNPRLSGGVIGSMRAGLNVPVELVRLALGLPVERQVAQAGVETPSPYRLRAATGADARRLWEWANDPSVRRQAFHEAQIPWETHQTWFGRKLADPEACLLAILESSDGSAVGQIRFDRGDEGLEIDIAINPAYRGKRLGRELLRQGLRHAQAKWVRGTRVIAHVLDGNAASTRLFAESGFVSAGRRRLHGKACERWEGSV